MSACRFPPLCATYNLTAKDLCEAVLLGLMTQADRPDGKKNEWWVPARGLRPVHETVIIAVLGFLIGTLAVGVLYFIS